ncbi:MAG: hypothetical protein HRU21_09340 [Pseudomonadales bacterium]|nr:hypothetical protein [Pseudomonadales bacterium]
MKLRKVFAEQREITAPVLVPDEGDYHGHIYSEEEVHQACRNYRENCRKANIQHAFDISKDTAEFVEHYLAPADIPMETTDGTITVKKGTWLATMKIKNDTLWQDVKDGKFTGFSISANCMSQKLSKSKYAGGNAVDEGHRVEKRLFDIDFSEEDHHVALVDEAANATKILVMKAKQPQTKDKIMSVEDKKAQEALAKEKAKKELEAEAVKKAKDKEYEELKKFKADQLAKEETQAEELKKERAKAKAEHEELEALRKAKDEAETAEFVQKAKDLKADDAEGFGSVLKKCKYALDEVEFETLEKQLGKLANITKAEDNGTFNNVGESNAEKLVKSKDQRIAKLRAEKLAAGVGRHLASKQARQEVEAEMASAQ